MKDKTIKPVFLQLDEKINAADYLEKAPTFIKQTETDNMAWKWAIISLHTALYGFAVCACAGTSPDIVAPKKNKGKGKRWLIKFDDALKYCQNPEHMNMYVHSKHLILDKQQKNSIKSLKNIFRNNFEHFSPQIRSIKLNGMPNILIDILDIIRFLAIETKNIHFN